MPEAAAPPQAQVDGVGIWWMIWACSWTAVLVSGMSYLWTKRQMPMLRIRGLHLSFAAVVLLHLYWLAVQFGYVYGPFLTAQVEFWIMNIWLPCGIALFHASNTRFLYVAKAQKKFVHSSSESDRATIPPRAKTLLGRFRQMDHTNRMLLLVFTGMAFQLCLALFMFLVSRKFHPSFGIPGTEVHGTPAEQRAEAGRGWEWWPSVFWQFFWAWLVAPYILWQARRLNDTQGWRTQTIACCLSSLHATPMWLVGLYVPEMAPVNRYWIPPQWIAVSIMLLEIFTIFIPCWQVMKHRALCQETLDSIARWETKQKASGISGAKSVSTGSTNTSWMNRSRASSVTTSSGGSVLTMDALELTLARNPAPLQHFSALRDFSGENVAFLMRLKEWRETHLIDDRKSRETQKEPTTRVMSSECFASALHIYLDFISPRGAEFQINLAHPDFKKLEAVFEHSASTLYNTIPEVNPVTPFEIPSRLLHTSASQTAITQDQDGQELSTVSPSRTLPAYDIPEGFDETVFDDAETSIKYLVLTNTWPKFIKERRSFESA